MTTLLAADLQSLSLLRSMETNVPVLLDFSDSVI